MQSQHGRWVNTRAWNRLHYLRESSQLVRQANAASDVNSVESAVINKGVEVVNEFTNPATGETVSVAPVVETEDKKVEEQIVEQTVEQASQVDTVAETSKQRDDVQASKDTRAKAMLADLQSKLGMSREADSAKLAEYRESGKVEQVKSGSVSASASASTNAGARVSSSEKGSSEKGSSEKGSSEKGSSVEKRSAKKPPEPIGSQVKPKDFSLIHAHQSMFDAFSVVMSLADVEDYLDYERSLYRDDFGNMRKDKDIPLSERWQRKLDSKRGKEIGHYLIDNEQHFFPPLLVIPATRELHSQLDKAAKQATGSADNHLMINVRKGELVIIDGQHRKYGVENAFGMLKSKQYQPSSDSRAREDKTPEQWMEDLKRLSQLKNETMPIVIINIDPTDLETRQQLFSDINKSPRKVSKALSTLYDHSGDTEVSAKKAIEDGRVNIMVGVRLVERSLIGNDDKKDDLVDMEHSSPLRTGSYAVSLVQVTNLLKPTKGQVSQLLEKMKTDELTQDDITMLLSGIVEALPDIDKLASGAEFQDLSAKYTCYSGPFWQGFGRMIDSALFDYGANGPMRGASGEQWMDSKTVLDHCVNVVRYLTQETEKGDTAYSWSMNANVWTANRIVTGGRVENKSDRVGKFKDVLRGLFTDLVNGDIVLEDVASAESEDDVAENERASAADEMERERELADSE